MEKRMLYGVVCASICPMHEDGSVDVESVKRLTRHLVDNGIHCLYPNGTNGESLSLSGEERCLVARTIHEENAGKAVLYIQCGAGTVKESYEQMRFTAELGADGAGLMTPVFFPTDDAALLRYYDEILDELPELPTYAYNIPTRTGNDLSPKVLGELMAKHDNLLGAKYSFPDILKIQRYVDCCPGKRASVLIGCDALATACLNAGGDGWVSGPSAAFPRQHVALYDALKAGDTQRAVEIQRCLRTLADSMADIPEIPAIKHWLKRLGVIESEYCRPPFRPLTEAECARLDALQDEYLK